MSDVRHDAENQRYVLDVAGEEAVAEYERQGDMIVFTHTVVPPAEQGQGIGSALVAGALADARRNGLRVVARCPFVAAYIERHPDSVDG